MLPITMNLSTMPVFTKTHLSAYLLANPALSRVRRNNQSVFQSVHWRHLLLSVLLIGLTGCASAPKTPLLSIERDIAAAGLAPSAVTVLLQPVGADKPSQSWRAEAPMAPASTLKLVTSIKALETLGPNWRGEHRLLLHPDDRGRARLQHPLVLQGYAATDFHYDNLWFMLKQLHDMGVRDLSSGIIVDRHLFTPLRPLPEQAPFDQKPRARYNHIPDALMMQQNMHVLTLSSKQDVVARISPHWPQLQIDTSQLQLVSANCQQADLHQLHYQLQPITAHGYRLVIQGLFPDQCELSTQLELIDRDLNLAMALQSMWQQLGGQIGQPSTPPLSAEPQIAFHWLRHEKTPVDYQMVVQYQSRPLTEILFRVNKFSDNAVTRVIYQAIAHKANANPALLQTQTQTQPRPQQQAPLSSNAIADALVANWLAQHQIDSTGLVMDNGSGLSRQARISAAQMAAVLQLAWQAPYATELVASMPLAGVDGSLRNRFRGTAAAERARLKTGTLRDVSGLAGYVWDSDGQPWIFVGLVNDPAANSKGYPLLERWVIQLAEFEK